MCSHCLAWLMNGPIRGHVRKWPPKSSETPVSNAKPRGWFKIKLPSYKNMNYYCGDKNSTAVLSLQQVSLYWSDCIFLLSLCSARCRHLAITVMWHVRHSISNQWHRWCWKHCHVMILQEAISGVFFCSFVRASSMNIFNRVGPD